jgi:N-terminal region of Chorein or VPS13
MTGYMYNPSKKVSEILSQYLEFDPEQLSLGIWSGNLSLHDVSLREDAVYPILNRHLNKNSASSSGSRVVAPSHSARLDYCPPPARFKLVSGSIGSLEMKIPWKRLVWGPGDVEVKLRNVVLVVALESVEETEQRVASQKDHYPTRVAGGNSASDQCRERHPWDFPGVAHHDEPNESDPNANARGGDRSANPELVRELHQTRLREAEKRLLEGRWNASWMEGVRKKDMEKIAKLVKERESSDSESHANSWLASATKDFFWRFCAGLVLDLENLKVILVQDSVELGIVMPSVRLANAKASTTVGVAPTNFEGSDASTFGVESTAGHEDMIYRGIDTDEGEQIDKTIRILGLGLFIRRRDCINPSPVGTKPYRFAPDVTTKEFIVRPVDCSYEYSFFYPTPPDKRKRKENHNRKDSQDHTATTVVSGEGSSAGSSKRRRGKRDKISSPEVAPTSSSAALSSPTTQPKIGFDLSMTNIPKPALAASLRQRRASTVGSSFAPNTRRQSIAFRPTPQRPPSVLRSSSTAASAPLVQPDNIASAYASAAANNRDTIRLESKMTVGAVEVIISSSHYNLFMALLCSCAQTRNGRPKVSIQSEIDDVGRAATRSLVVRATSRPSGAAVEQRVRRLPSSVAEDNRADDPELRLHLQGFRSRRDALRKWWLYATRLVVWELRERKRLRMIFQKRFLFFSWKTQKYRRREYVSLFIAVHLRKSAPSDDTQALDDLLAIEDELAVEQVLLYRSIARAVFVRGKREMPESILAVRDNAAAHKHELVAEVVDRFDTVQKSTKQSREAPSFLSMLEKQGDVARTRVQAEDQEHLLPYDPIRFPSSTADTRLASVVYDDSTYAHTVDTRAVRNQRRKALNLTDIEGAQERRAMFVSFSFSLDKMEVVVVEDSNLGYASADGTLHAHDGSDSTSSFESEVSVLTDDQRFFKEAGNMDRSPIESEVSDDPPILSSTDFLIFNAPENILLRVSVSPVVLSLLARSGGSRSATLKIGKIVAFGDANKRFLHIGKPSKAAPLAEVGAGTAFQCSSGSDWGQEAPSSALSLSLIVNNSASIVECDASTICVTAEIETFAKINGFRRGTCGFPKRMLSRSIQEDARLHLLRQAGHQWQNVNSSVRLHGFELALPASMESKDQAIEDATNGSEEDEKPNIALRLTMLEVYSGTAVTALAEAADDAHASLRMSGGRSLQMSGRVRLSKATRTLRMLDVTERTTNRPSLRANHWVRHYSVSPMQLHPPLPHRHTFLLTGT